MEIQEQPIPNLLKANKRNLTVLTRIANKYIAYLRRKNYITQIYNTNYTIQTFYYIYIVMKRFREEQRYNALII
jgi:hypothetical protein